MLGLLGHGPGDDGVEGRRHPGADRRRRARQMGPELCLPFAHGERDTTRQRVEEHAAERIDVRVGTDGLAPDLLRRDVVEGPEQLPGACLGLPELGQQPLAQAEVGEVSVVVGREQDVRRLDVAMHEPGGVGRVERGGDLGGDVHGPVRWQRALARDQVLEVDSIDEAHRQEQHLEVLAGLEDGDHVRVIERGGRLRLGLEAPAEGAVARKLGGDELEGHRASQRQVRRLVDHAHAPAACQLLEFVSREPHPRG